jgi:hypothetical protein
MREGEVERQVLKKGNCEPVLAKHNNNDNDNAQSKRIR